MRKSLQVFSAIGLLVALILGMQLSSVAAADFTFSSSGSTTIPASGTGPGASSTYPWNIAVSGVTGNITKVTVTLTGLSHSFPSDVDVLLAAPDGTNTVLIASAGDGVNAVSLNLTFDDSAATTVPAPMVSGTFKPTRNYTTMFTGVTDAGNTSLSVFNGLSDAAVNGDWKLYVFDNFTQDSGSLGGWSITISAEVLVVPTDDPTAEPDESVASVPNTDNDGDGIPNDRDNCAQDYNPSQEDGWGSGQGDACDTSWYNQVGVGVAAFVQKSGLLNVHGNCAYLDDGAPRCPEIAILDPSTFTPDQMPMQVETDNAGSWSVVVHYLHSNDGDVYQVNIYTTNPPQPDSLIDDRLEIHVHGSSWKWYQRGGDVNYGGLPDGIYSGASGVSGDEKKG